MKSKHTQRDGWEELISRYGRRVSPSASRGKGELMSAGRLQYSLRKYESLKLARATPCKIGLSCIIIFTYEKQ